MRISLATVATALIALVVASPALSWTWPVEGRIARPFVFGDDPYAAGQHRGVDIAAAVGAIVRAPSSGAVTFAGTVPRGGGTVTISTTEGHAITLQQLAGVLVGRGDVVGEGDPIGEVAESRDPAAAYPHVHFGVRLADVEHGYIDPLSLLLTGVFDLPVPGTGSSGATEASPLPASSAGPSTSGGHSYTVPEGARPDSSSAERVAATVAVAPSTPSLTPPEPVDSAAVAPPAPPLGEGGIVTNGGREAPGVAGSEGSSPTRSALDRAGATSDASTPYEPRPSVELPRPPTDDESGGETPKGGAEPGAASGALDPIEVTTPLGAAIAGRSETDAAASEPARDEPIESSEPQQQSVPGQPADAGQGAGTATTAGTLDVAVEAPRVNAEHSPAHPPAALPKAGAPVDLGRAVGSAVAEGPSAAVPSDADAGAPSAHERSRRERGRASPQEKERLGRGPEADSVASGEPTREPNGAAAGAVRGSVASRQKPAVQEPGLSLGRSGPAPAPLATPAPASEQSRDPGSGGSPRESRGAISLRAVELAGAPRRANARSRSGGLSAASVAAFLVAGVGFGALLLLCRSRPPGIVGRVAPRPRAPIDSRGSMASRLGSTASLDGPVSAQTARPLVGRSFTERRRRRESEWRREDRGRRHRRRLAPERRPRLRGLQPTGAREGRRLGVLARSDRRRRL